MYWLYQRKKSIWTFLNSSFMSRHLIFHHFYVQPQRLVKKTAISDPLQHKCVPVFWNNDGLLIHSWTIDMDVFWDANTTLHPQPVLVCVSYCFLGGIRVHESMHEEARAPASPSVLLTVHSLKGLQSLGWEIGRKTEAERKRETFIRKSGL